MLKNKIKEVLEAGGMALGTWIEMKNPEACEAAAASGFDFVVIDAEHGDFGVEGAVEMIRAVEAGGATTVLRLPDGSPTGIQKALGAGAVGILIPEVRTGEEASQIVRAAKYAPAGTRGATAFVRCTMHGAIDWKVYSEWSERNTMVWVMVENTEAVKNIDSILSSGVDAISLGPYDLSVSMGLKGDFRHSDVVSVLDRVTQVASNRGVDVVFHLGYADFDVSTPEGLLETARSWKKKGCRIVTQLSDRQCLTDRYREVVAKFREL